MATPSIDKQYAFKTDYIAPSGDFEVTSFENPYNNNVVIYRYKRERWNPFLSVMGAHIQVTKEQADQIEKDIVRKLKAKDRSMFLQ
jgi:cell fate regulator YaaT (PSP1 superfamily)